MWTQSHPGKSVRPVFPRRRKSKADDDIITKQYVMNTGIFHFGPLLCGKSRDWYKAKHFPSNCEKITILNITPLEAEVHFSFEHDLKADMFLLDPPSMRLKANEKQVIEPSTCEEGETIAIIPVRVSAKAVFSKNSVYPASFISFGALVNGSRKTCTFMLENKGTLNFKFLIYRTDQNAALSPRKSAHQRKSACSHESENLSKMTPSVKQSKHSLQKNANPFMQEGFSILSPPSGLLAAFVVDDVESIFEEHRICSNINLCHILQTVQDKGVFTTDENKFIFTNVLAGHRATARFKIHSVDKVPCDGVLSIKPIHDKLMIDLLDEGGVFFLKARPTTHCIYQAAGMEEDAPGEERKPHTASLVLHHGESAEFDVLFKPTLAQRVEGRIHLSVVDNPYEETNIQLVGEGYEDDFMLDNIHELMANSEETLRAI
ncbi:unnamed protein product [Bubo scandiacus]